MKILSYLSNFSAKAVDLGVCNVSDFQQWAPDSGLRVLDLLANQINYITRMLYALPYVYTIILLLYYYTIYYYMLLYYRATKLRA